MSRVVIPIWNTATGTPESLVMVAVMVREGRVYHVRRGITTARIVADGNAFDALAAEIAQHGTLLCERVARAACPPLRGRRYLKIKGPVEPNCSDLPDDRDESAPRLRLVN